MKTPRPSKGTVLYAFVKFFVNCVNFCEGQYYDSDEAKPDNPVYDFFYRHWLFPFDQNDCLCCNTVRGLMYGFALGVIVGVLL